MCSRASFVSSVPQAIPGRTLRTVHSLPASCVIVTIMVPVISVIQRRASVTVHTTPWGTDATLVWGDSMGWLPRQHQACQYGVHCKIFRIIVQNKSNLLN